METNYRSTGARAFGPFDRSAEKRLSHMGLTENGEISDTAVSQFAGIFSGLFFDDVFDCFSPTEAAEICQAIVRMSPSDSCKRMYLYISLQYDRMRKPLPDPVWWIAGNPDAVRAFTRHFAEKLEYLAKQNTAVENNGKEV
jgi:hypothetical protein